MPGRHGHWFAGESQLLDFEWLSKQRLLSSKNQEARRNKNCIRVHCSELPGFPGIQRSHVDRVLFLTSVLRHGAVQEVPCIRQELWFDLGSLMARIIELKHWAEFSACG